MNPLQDQCNHVLKINGNLRNPGSVRLKLLLCKNNNTFLRHEVYLAHILGKHQTARTQQKLKLKY